MRVQAGPRGVLLPDARLALDTQHPGFVSVCSHAHADHVPWDAAHCHATPPTRDLLARRAPYLRVDAHAYGEPFTVNGARITFLPSGHVLGAALTRVEFEGETLLYTADFKLKAPATCTPCARGADVACDVLVVESTFGLPVYQFLDGAAAGERVRAFARVTLEDGGVPVFLGYNLGKAHEIARLLGERGVPVMMHGAAWNLVDAYRAHGVDFPLAVAYEKDRVPGHALVVPPNARTSPMVTNLKDARVAYCSGWAALENQRLQRDLDALVPMSDHCDFPDLVTFVRETGARKVYANHGYADAFCHVLRTRYDLDSDALHVGEFREEETLDEDPRLPGARGGAPRDA